jgi:hypothetical protein
MNPRALFLCLLSVTAFAQDKPIIKVVVSRCESIGSKNCEDGRLSGNQLQWWRETGEKKFPRVRLVETREEADWILFWASDEAPYTVTTPTTATTTHHPETNTSQTTINHGQQQEKVVIYVDANLRKLTHADGVSTFSKIPEHIARHKGRWLWSKPDKDAFEQLLKKVK